MVRGDDGRLRLRRTCQHQGAPLCLGTGGGLREIECANHRWTWDLSGRLKAVDFGAPVEADQDIPLQPLVIETWGPLVFASFDPAAPPLTDALSTLARTLDQADIDPDGLRCRSVVPSPPTGTGSRPTVSLAGDVRPGSRHHPGLAVKADAGSGTVTVVRVRPATSVDRAFFDVLTFEPRAAASPPTGPRPLDVTLKDDDDVPPDCGVDLDLIAFARAQQGAPTPTDDLVVDEASAPELVELHAWLDRHLPPPTA